MNVINGFWESNDDFNCAEFVTPAFVEVVLNGQAIELDRDENNHPACELLGSFCSEEIPGLLAKAKKWGVSIFNLNDGQELIA